MMWEKLVSLCHSSQPLNASEKRLLVAVILRKPRTAKPLKHQAEQGYEGLRNREKQQSLKNSARNKVQRFRSNEAKE
jgi:hypothetical protein